MKFFKKKKKQEEQPVKLKKINKPDIWAPDDSETRITLREESNLIDARKLSGKHQKMPSLKDLEGYEPVALTRSQAVMDLSIK